MYDITSFEESVESEEELEDLDFEEQEWEDLEED